MLAAALLAQSRPGISAQALSGRIRRFRAFLERGGGRVEDTAAGPRIREQKALARFLRDGLVERLEGPEDTVFRVLPEKRITMEYYKNAILHRFAPASLLAAVIRARGEESFSPLDLQEGLRFQLFLFRYEFVFDPDADEEDIATRALSQLESAEAITLMNDGSWVVLNKARVGEMAELTLNFLESYYVVLRGLQQVRDKDLAPKQLAREMQKAGRQFRGYADIQRPEALSLVNLENALKALAESGIYHLRTGGGGVEIDAQGSADYLSRLRWLLRKDT